MSALEPPRLALTLLHRFGPDNEALAGDLVEEFDRRRSRLWFWRQVVAAIAIAGFRRPQEIRPLHLVDQRITPLRTLPSRALVPLNTLNLTASPIHGYGGLSIVFIVMLATIVQPALWTLAMIAVLLGIICGVTLITVRRRRRAAAMSSLEL